AELHPAARADESRGVEHEVRRIELRAARILARRGPFCATLVLGIDAHKGFVSEGVETVFHARGSRERRGGLTTAGLAARAHDGIAIGHQRARIESARAEAEVLGLARLGVTGAKPEAQSATHGNVR